MNDCHNCNLRDEPANHPTCRECVRTACVGSGEYPNWEPRPLPASDGCTTPVPQKGALDVQVGGGHYKDMAIQPVEYIHKNKIGFIEGAVIKYVSRWRSKNGIQDLEKARHFIDLLIELESK